MDDPDIQRLQSYNLNENPFQAHTKLSNRVRVGQPDLEINTPRKAQVFAKKKVTQHHPSDQRRPTKWQKVKEGANPDNDAIPGPVDKDSQKFGQVQKPAK